MEHFTNDLRRYAERNHTNRNTTCLVHKSGNSYFCQTDTGGDGFEIENINDVIKAIKKLGFKVEFKKKKGYCPLDISWALV